MQFRLFLLVMFLMFIWVYDWSCFPLEKVQQMYFDDWYQNEFLPEAFQDTIKKKVDFSTYYFKRVHYSSTHLHPQGVLKLDYQTYDFIAVGDVLSKKAGSTMATVVKKNGEIQSFELKYCKLKFFKNSGDDMEQ